MNKKVFTVLAAIIISLAVCTPVSAHEPGLASMDDGYHIYSSNPSYFSEEGLAALDNKALNIAIKSSTEVLFAINEYVDNDTIEYAENFYTNASGNENGILFLVTKDYWYVHCAGNTGEIFSEVDKDKIWDEYNKAKTYYDGVDAYLNIVSDKLADIKPPSYGDGSRLIDTADVLTDDEQWVLKAYFTRIADRYDFDIASVIVSSFEGMSADEYADSLYENCNFGRGDTKDGILLVANIETKQWATYAYGRGEAAFTEAGQKYMYDTYGPILDAKRYAEALNSYAGLCDRFLTQAESGVPFNAENLPVIPQEKILPRLVDDADILTDGQEKDLLNKLDAVSEDKGCDVAVVTVYSLGTKTAEQYADDFYDYNGYGMNATDDGILLLISMEARDWAIFTYGYGITAFTDAGQKYLTDQFIPELSEGDYYEAFVVFAEQCEKFLTQAAAGEPFDTQNLPKEPFDFIMWLCISVFAGLVIAIAVTNGMKAQLKSVHFKTEAADYITPGSFNLTGSYERFLYSDVKKTKRESDSSGGGSSSGSSTHTSSSGRSHGGSSGKF